MIFITRFENIYQLKNIILHIQTVRNKRFTRCPSDDSVLRKVLFIVCMRNKKTLSKKLQERKLRNVLIIISIRDTAGGLMENNARSVCHTLGGRAVVGYFSHNRSL